MKRRCWRNDRGNHTRAAHDIVDRVVIYEESNLARRKCIGITPVKRKPMGFFGLLGFGAEEGTFPLRR